jgi:serine/threonine-protein kinase
MTNENNLLNQRYRLLDRIGAGGMSVVYRAQDLALGRIVAIKILHDSLTGDATFLERFRREAHAAASLSHPNVVTVHDVGQDGNRHYIVMQLVEGQDLKTIIRREAPLSLEKAINLTIQICQGIGYAHRAGFVHCDVKPQNVLVTEDGRALVADFGIARIVTEATASRTDLAWGTPHYFSPEQAAGEKATPSSDVYAIGVILFEMLAGRLPFEADSPTALALMHLRDEPPRVTDLNPEVPLPITKIIHKVLSKEPSARYRTADQFGRILDRYRTESFQNTGPSVPQARLATVGTPPSFYGPPTHSISLPASPAVPVRAATTMDVDWATIFLGAIALLAVLGLVPLWVFVYQAYTQPAPPPGILPVLFLTIRSFPGIIK